MPLPLSRADIPGEDAVAPEDDETLLGSIEQAAVEFFLRTMNLFHHHNCIINN